MRIINKLTKRHLLKNKKRTLVTIIAITLTSTLLFSLGFAFSSYQKSELKQIESSANNYDAYVENVTYNQKNILDNNKDIAKYEYISKIYDTDYLCYKTGYGENIKDVYLKVYTISNGINFNLKYGKLPENEKEAIITFNLDYKLGSIAQFNVIDNNGEKHLKEYKIVGIIDSGRADWNSIIFTKDDNKINNDSITTFNIYLKNKKKAYEKLFNIASSLGLNETYEIGEGIAYENMYFNTSLLELYGNHRNYTKKAIIYISLIILLTVLSIASAFIIYNSFAISLSDRKQQIGILKSVGMTKKQIRKLIIKEALYISLIAIPLGFIISYLFVISTIKYINYIQDGVRVYTIGFDLSYLLMSLIFIILTVLYSAFFPAMRASEITPIEAIRQNKDIKYKKTKKTFITKLFGIYGFIAKVNMKRNKSKYKIALIGSIISIILFMSVATFINFFEKGLERNNTAGATLSSQADFNDIQKETAKILKSKTIDDYLLFSYKTINIKGNFDAFFTDEYKYKNLKFDRLSMVRIDDKTYNDIKKKYKIKNNEPILFNVVRVSDNKNQQQISIFKKGSVINASLCEFQTENCINYSLNLINEIPNKFKKFEFNSGFLLVNEDIFSRIKQYEKYDENALIEIVSNDYVKLDKEIKKFLNDTDNLYEFINVGIESIHEMNDFKCLKIVLYTLIFLFASISITSIINTISVSMNLRKREFAILKSVGLDKKGFNKILLLESLLLTLKTLIYGTIFSLFVVYLIQNTFNLGKKKYAFMQIFPVKYFVLTMIIVFVTITLTIYLCMQKLKKDNIIETIKNDNI